MIKELKTWGHCKSTSNLKLAINSSSSFEEVSTPGQTQTGLGPRVYPFTTPGCCMGFGICASEWTNHKWKVEYC